ncbi:hypothetical protein Tco_0652531 [Tanacetum coccineum]|uniref:Uncharacterized protein n=1 Tax=Tanacetum coccineum TaxID=301880 RepID=A0ABQ4WXU0_9ASTR
MHVIVDWKMYRREKLKLMIRIVKQDVVDAEIVGIMADPKEVNAGEVAGTSGMSSFAWILSKMLPATSESGIHTLAIWFIGADWPPIIEEKEMPNAVRCEDSFVEKIVRRNNVTIDELPENHSNTLPLKAVSKCPLTAPFVWFSGLK